MTLQAVLETIENHDFMLHPYKENGVLCGYEMEGWTDCGVDIIHFIDCRDEEGVTARNVIEEFKQIYVNFDADEEIDLHRKGEDYRNAFTIRQSLEDFDGYAERLKALWLELDKKDKE